MIEMILPDGSKRQLENPMTVVEFAKSIGSSLGKATVGAVIDGVQVDPSYVIDKSGEIEIITNTSEKGIEIIRHSAAHIMAQAVQRLFPNTKVTIGPVVENGFFYDFDPERPFTEEDLAKIEEEMKKIVKENYPFERSEMSAEEAKKFFAEKGETYKVEIIDDLGVDKVSIYKQGEFVDLCRGTHVPSTGYLKAFKLMSTAGAYWRGDSKNKMLQRIYGVAFASKKELDEYLTMMEEAERRDHRKLGKQLNLFFLDEHGPGFPFFMPKGVELFNKLQEIWRVEHKKRGYQEIKTPIMLDRELWEISGHWFNYRENMYTSVIDEKTYAIKPMNCPGSIISYKNNLHSYKDLPLKYGEMGLVHRHEFSGALHGLMRVRAFTQDDAHVFCTKEQIEEQIIEIIDLYDKFYTLFGFEYHIELSTKPDKAIGSDEIWEMAEANLKSALEHKGIDYKLNPGDGAFYGPKIDFKMKDSIGRIWQCGTIQLDFNLPQRFEMSYIGADGEKHEPVMIHRAMYGSLERFLGILIEHYAGAFPTWLAPVQARILTISDEQVPFAKEVFEKLQNAGIRVELDTRVEKIGYKIREANGDQKIPVQLIIGKNEAANNEVNMRRFGSQESKNVSVDEILNILVEESKVPFKK
jgi:threonine--tRNA ligase